MKLFNFPGRFNAILFDLDSTLYTHEEYARTLFDHLTRRLAGVQGKSFDQMNSEITEYRKKWAEDHNGQSISYANTFTAFGISIEENIRWRNELYQPEKYLSKDEKLRTALIELSSRFKLAVVTNNTVTITKRTLNVLGVHDILEIIVGLDSCFLSKPHKTPFLKAAAACGTAVENCISVGDRYDIDIALPVEMGMGGVLVTGVEDVYKLPLLLKK